MPSPLVPRRRGVSSSPSKTRRRHRTKSAIVTSTHQRSESLSLDGGGGGGAEGESKRARTRMSPLSAEIVRKCGVNKHHSLLTDDVSSCCEKKQFGSHHWEEGHPSTPRGDLTRMCGCFPCLLFDSQVPEFMREKHIIGGYRNAKTSRQCLISVFHFHNETLNIWTHFLGFLIFLGLLVYTIVSLSPLSSSSGMLISHHNQLSPLLHEAHQELLTYLDTSPSQARLSDGKEGVPFRLDCSGNDIRPMPSPDGLVNEQGHSSPSLLSFDARAYVRPPLNITSIESAVHMLEEYHRRFGVLVSRFLSSTGDRVSDLTARLHAYKDDLGVHTQALREVLREDVDRAVAYVKDRGNELGVDMAIAYVHDRGQELRHVVREDVIDSIKHTGWVGEALRDQLDTVASIAKERSHEVQNKVSVFLHEHTTIIDAADSVDGAMHSASRSLHHLVQSLMPSLNDDIVHLQENVSDSPQWPIYVYIFSAMCCLFFSTLYHTFCCKDLQSCVTFGRLDYSGIVLLICGSMIPIAMYASAFGVLRWVYTVVLCVLGSALFVIAQCDFFHGVRFRSLRAYLFFGYATFGLLPGLHLVYAYGTGHVMGGLYLKLALMALCYVGGLTVYILRIPERWFPGKCDIWFHSHQFWHIFVVLAALAHCAFVFDVWRFSHLYLVA
eukprot:TRINITY_DN5800_c0_g1_i1.p1 TRINITY_DN5800_c0_g1~~TRINITY_DN5800_c0_g1_i1.p1  ORF type:complete len:719 (-),score=124.85 TRINITY_DN5800_c0_g1_i1:22-2016(-)